MLRLCTTYVVQLYRTMKISSINGDIGGGGDAVVDNVLKCLLRSSIDCY